MKNNSMRKIALSAFSVLALASVAVGFATVNDVSASANTIVYVETPGASVKLTGDSGIRFPMYLTEAAADKTVAESYTVVIPADMIAEDAMLDKNTSNATVVDTTDHWQTYTDNDKGDVTASFVYLYDIPLNSYTREIAFRSYVKFTDGTEGYSEQQTRSIASVANTLDANAYEGEEKTNLEKYQVEVAYGTIMNFAEAATLSESVSQIAGQAPALWANYYGDFENIAWGVTVTGNVEDVNSLTYVAGNTTVAIDVSGLTSGVKSIVTTPISALTDHYAAFQEGVFKADIASGSSTTVAIDKVFALPAAVTKTESATTSVAFAGYETTITGVSGKYGNTATVDGNSFTASGADEYTVACTVDGYAYTYKVDCFMQSGANVLVNTDTYRGVSQVKGVSNCAVSYTTADKYQTESGALKLTVTNDAKFIDFDISSLNITDLTDYVRLEFAIRFVPADGDNTGYYTFLMPNVQWNTWHSSSQDWEAMSYNVSTFADAGYTLESLTTFRIQITADVQVGDVFYLGAFRLVKAEKKIGGVETSLTTTTAEYTLPTAKVVDQYNNTYADSVSCKVLDSAGQELTITNGKVTLPAMGQYTLTYSAMGYSELVCTLTYSVPSGRAGYMVDLDTYYGVSQVKGVSNCEVSYTTADKYQTESGALKLTVTKDAKFIDFDFSSLNITDLTDYVRLEFAIRFVPADGVNTGYTTFLMPNSKWNTWHSSSQGWQVMTYNVSTFADAGYTLESLTTFRIQITADVQVGDVFYLGSFRLIKE